ncbi:MAG: hypothetical protein M3R66_08690 [Actinomycetota bacterium]|nr:hypothetical protein [Actinomycetota bacterium]
MRLRMFLGAAVWSLALLGLGACTSSISGTPTFVGPTQTTEESSEETTEETEETTDEAPSGDPDELFDCLSVLFSYNTANSNFVELADATNNGTPTSLTPESVATEFDDAIDSVQPVLDPLPPGAVRDALQAAQDAAAGLRDGLRAGSAVDNTALNTALDSIATACDF